MSAKQSESAYQAATFEPKDRANTTPSINHPDEIWTTVLESRCTFNAEIFTSVMLNLVKNPNITSTYLFRADIFYDSEKDQDSLEGTDTRLVRSLKPEYRPVPYALPGFVRNRTIVRQLVPRNPQLDAPLIQTCHFYTQWDERSEQNMVIYIPHVEHAEAMPFYHPSVAKLAFEHTSHHLNSDSPHQPEDATISISYCFFPSTSSNSKLDRTALRLLQTIHKHGQGQLSGYEKRVHLDRIVPQKRYQDTYTQLKTKYGKHLAENWVEVTDPGKHVFEDIGIAAFCIELWRDMFGDAEKGNIKESFPGFVDIGCGNGILVYILLSEGYKGWGFDARERKTWSIYPPEVQRCLQRKVLVPDAFDTGGTKADGQPLPQHNGTFEPGTFIISNHADELTAWTPLLAYLNNSAFIAIPCCSHDLSGSRFRAPPSTKQSRSDVTRLPQQQTQRLEQLTTNGDRVKQVAETGSLKRTEAQKKMPSAYSTLCSYVSSLAEEVGFVSETDVLRIPSTRNNCIIGRSRRSNEDEDPEVKRLKVIGIVESELGRSISVIGQEWKERGRKLAEKPGSGH